MQDEPIIAIYVYKNGLVRARTRTGEHWGMRSEMEPFLLRSAPDSAFVHLEGDVSSTMRYVRSSGCLCPADFGGAAHAKR